MTAVQFEVEGGRLRPGGEGVTLLSCAAALPDGAYTTLRTYGRDRVLRLAQHVARLNESVALEGKRGVLSTGDVGRALALALRETGHEESRLRLTFSPPRFFVAVEPFVPLPAEAYRDGVACATVPVRRSVPHAKDTRFAAEAERTYRSLPDGAHEGLMVAPDGSLLEGLSSNFFALVAGVLRTEKSRALLGVTRSLVLELAAGVVGVQEEAPRRQELPATSEAFLTSVSRGVLPVVRIDDRVVGTGAPGPLTGELASRLALLADREAERVAP